MAHEPLIDVQFVMNGLEDLIAIKPGDRKILAVAIDKILLEMSTSDEALQSPLAKDCREAMKTLKFVVAKDRKIVVETTPRFERALFLLGRGSELFKPIPDLLPRLLHEIY